MQRNRRPLYIFDIDGTLCNIEHRLHFLENKEDPNRWKQFYRACKDDVPNGPVIRVLEALVDSGAEVWFFSGRSKDVRVETINWLIANTSFVHSFFRLNPAALTMRPSKDFTEDHLLKRDWLWGDVGCGPRTSGCHLRRPQACCGHVARKWRALLPGCSGRILMPRGYKPAERYKADFQKISKIFLVKVLLTFCSLIFVCAWFGYWAMK